jgi:SpoVK/Ycf46/Vps4 family AAA+-type ATPase
VTNGINRSIPDLVEKTKNIEEDLINSVSGLTLMEAQSAYCKSLVSEKKWDIPMILQEKRQIISKSNVLDFYDNTITLKDIGGLKNLINWIKIRKKCFSKEAEEYGLQKPKGILLMGTPGCVLADTKIKIKKISKKGKVKIYEK